MTKTTRLGVKEAREVFPSLVDQAAAGSRIIVTLYGKDRCAIVPLSDLPEALRPAVQAKPAKSRR